MNLNRSQATRDYWAHTIARGFLCVTAIIVVNVCGPQLLAAPPTVNYLHPAGGQRGTTVEVTAVGTFERWPVQVWTDDPAVSIKCAKDKGKLSATVAADAVPGVHWLRMHDEQGASTMRPFIVGTLPEVLEKEPNDEIAKALVIDSSCAVNGRLAKAGDVDVFAMKLNKGETLVASVDAFETLRSPMDAVLQILSADGFVLEQNNDWSGLDPQIVFQVPKDGTYAIRLFAFPSTPDASIRLSGGEAYVYRLTLTTGGFIDYALPLAVSRDSNARVTLEGWNIPTEAKSVSWPIAGDSATVFHPRVANAFRLRIEDHPSWKLLGEKGKSPSLLTPPFSATAGIPGEPISITGKKGQTLNIRVDSRDLGLKVNPVIRVLDFTGKQLVRVEPPTLNKDTETNFTPTADGTFRIEVADLFGGSGPRYVYRLRVAPPEPGFDLSVAADRIALALGKPTDIAVTVTRRGGFNKEIALFAEGLPMGVKVEPTPPAKGDAKTQTLRLSAESAGPSSSFRVVGKSKEPAIVRTARAPLAEFETTTADLWLAVGGEVPTVPKKKKR